RRIAGLGAVHRVVLTCFVYKLVRASDHMLHRRPRNRRKVAPDVRESSGGNPRGQSIAYPFVRIIRAFLATTSAASLARPSRVGKSALQLLVGLPAVHVRRRGPPR